MGFPGGPNTSRERPMAIYRTGKIGDGGGGGGGEGGGAFPADVFVVLLKPRVNYARGINERPEQRAIGSKSGQLGSEQSEWSSTRVVPMWNISGNLTTARSKAQSLNSITETKMISMKQKRYWSKNAADEV